VKIRFLEEPVDYDGTAIHSLWAYRNFGIQGDSLLAFVGACDIPFDHMVDLEDVRAGKRIWSPKMLHFIEERFDTDLEKAVLRQRLLATVARDRLAERKVPVLRHGDDLFVGERKLSISIAAATPVSTKIHFGMNVVRAEGLDVPTEALATFGVQPKELADRVLESYAEELGGVLDARTRARGVP